jgi:hypothetical protein
VKGKHHLEMAKAGSSTRSLVSFSNPSQIAIEAETRWSIFVAKHNIAFLASDHATKLFSRMFPDSEIAKKFRCCRTKTTAIIKEAISPHFLRNATGNLSSSPFTLMIDESNDKTDKSSIILVRVFDLSIGNVCTRFLDMPMGSAQNFFQALKSSLTQKGLGLQHLCLITQRC